MNVWLEVTAPSSLTVLCSCLSPSALVRSRPCGSVMTKISRHRSLGGPLCPWLPVPFSGDSAAGFLFAGCIGVVWQLAVCKVVI